MSLIRIRRERRQGAAGPRRPPALWKLVAGLILALLLIWYLGRVT
ncbi:MAG TPA: hypothetical protein VNZ57_02005 [Longimicrobiales bacterium]|nr:hypothetical protein [Longimicrobiales bacterium]